MRNGLAERGRYEQMAIDPVVYLITHRVELGPREFHVQVPDNGAITLRKLVFRFLGRGCFLLALRRESRNDFSISRGGVRARFFWPSSDGAVLQETTIRGFAFDWIDLHPLKRFQQIVEHIIIDANYLAACVPWLSAKRAFGVSVRCYPSLPIAFLTWCE